MCDIPLKTKKFILTYMTLLFDGANQRPGLGELAYEDFE